MIAALARWWHRRWCALCRGATCVFCHRSIDTGHPDTVWMPIGPRHYECLVERLTYFVPRKAWDDRWR